MHPSIHPSTHFLPLFCRLSRFGSWRQQSDQRSFDLLFSSHLFQLIREVHRGVPKPAERSSLKRVLGLPQGLLPVEHPQNTSSRRHPGGILLRYLKHLNWVFPIFSGSSSTLSLSIEQAHRPISMGEASHSLKETYFLYLYPCPHFYSTTELGTKREGRNID